MSTNTTKPSHSNNYINAKSLQPEEIIVREQRKLEILRVARHELSSGSVSGAVLTRLSSGAVAFPIDRSVLQARIDRQILQTVESMETKEK
jgi:hypothetical protein